MGANLLGRAGRWDGFEFNRFDPREPSKREDK